jgi:hypothetical protein
MTILVPTEKFSQMLFAKSLNLVRTKKDILGFWIRPRTTSPKFGDNRELLMFARAEQVAEDRIEMLGFSKEEIRIRRIFASLTKPRNKSSREVEDSLMFLGRLVGTAARHGIPLDLWLPMTSAWNAIVEDNSSENDA